LKLEGGFETNVLNIVPSETVKKTIHDLAHSHLLGTNDMSIEDFAFVLSKFFLAEYEQVHSVALTIEQNEWKQLNKNGFKQGSDYVRFVNLHAIRGNDVQLCSGIKALDITKTTISNLLKDYKNHSTLQAVWKYPSADIDEHLKSEQGVHQGTLDFNDTFNQVRNCIIENFAGHSIKEHYNLNAVGRTILERVPRVKSVYLFVPIALQDNSKTFTEAFVTRHVTVPIHHHARNNLPHWGNHLHRMNRDFYVSKL